MNRAFWFTVLIASFATASFSQEKATPTKPAVSDKTTAATINNTPVEVAKATLAAHGGDKLKKMKSLVLRGSVDITGAFSSMVIPATFSMVIAGDRYVFELNNPMQPLKQIFDGKNTYSTGYEMPPMTSLGFPLMPKIGETGYLLATLPEAKGKKKGFRITTPDGFYTDFLVDEKTSQIKGYESSYDVNGRLVTTSVEIDEFQTVEGVIIPKKYSQRFDLGQLTVYANFKTKDILVNSTIAEDVFALPK